MSKIEEKVIAWLNNHMLLIVMLFVAGTALYVRAAGIKFMGIDFHYSLYDIPGNCHSVIYRKLAFTIMNNPDIAVRVLKALSYAGDFLAAFLVLCIFWRKDQKTVSTRSFLILTACLLSPSVLIYSVGNMRPDSLCMSLLLAGMLLYKKDFVPGAILTVGAAAYLYPIYWPAAVVLWIYMLRKRYRQNGGLQKADVIALVCIVLMLFCSVFLENRWLTQGYYWGKVFVYNPKTETVYANIGEWIAAMFKAYGYILSTGLLIVSFRVRKLRIFALGMQILVVMYVGWITTSHLIVT